MTDLHRRLYRNQNNKVFAGICSGLAEYLNMDVTIIRLVWVVLTLMGGAGIIAYIIAYFIIPEKPVGIGDAIPVQKHDVTAGRIFGFIFIGAGVAILLDNLDILSFHNWWHMSWEFVFPGLLILAGIYFLTKRPSQSVSPEISAPAEPADAQPKEQEVTADSSGKRTEKVFRRSLTDKKLFGICGGAGEYFDIDPTIIRIAYVVFTIISGGMGILIYLLMVLIVPEGRPQTNNQS